MIKIQIQIFLYISTLICICVCTNTNINTEKDIPVLVFKKLQLQCNDDIDNTISNNYLSPCHYGASSVICYNKGLINNNNILWVCNFRDINLKKVIIVSGKPKCISIVENGISKILVKSCSYEYTVKFCDNKKSGDTKNIDFTIFLYLLFLFIFTMSVMHNDTFVLIICLLSYILYTIDTLDSSQNINGIYNLLNTMDIIEPIKH